MALSTAARITTALASETDPHQVIRSSASVMGGLSIRALLPDGDAISVYEQPGAGPPDACVEVPCVLRRGNSFTPGRMRVEVWLP